MRTMNRIELLANPEVIKALKELKNVARRALPDGTFAEREASVLAIFEEAGRGLLEEDLQAISDELDERVLVTGVVYRRHQPGTGGYHSLNGGLQVRRDTYRAEGVRNGPTIVPLDLIAGLVEGATPALAYNVAHGYGQHDMRLHGEVLDAAHRSPPPRATLERLAKRLAAATMEAAPRVEPIVRRAERLPDGARGVCIGLDRTSVPMAEERAADAPPKPAKRRSKPRIRRAPPPIDVNYRMAYVGTVSIIDEDGAALATRRYAIPANDDPAKMAKRMTADVSAVLKRNPTMKVGTVQDGAPEMWNLTRTALTELQHEGVLQEWEEGIDRYHLLERLAAALDIVEPEAGERKTRLRDWNDRLDLKDSTIDSIERELERAYEALPRHRRDQLWEHLVYLANNKDRMRYVTLATSGLPNGSGVTESAAKTVVGRRAKNSGQRWSDAGLRGALTLRALHQSDRLPAFWTHLSRRYTAVVEAA
jgi:hypothetical protein